MFFFIICIMLIAFLTWAHQAIRPPPPKACGSACGPPITAPRIKQKDGRHLAYKEHGVPKEVARHKIIYVHGFRSCRHDLMIATNLSSEFFQKLDVFIVSFDRPGYGESDPNPNQTVKTLALDIEELADQLSLGSKFYVIGNSIGGLLAWGCLKYISNRNSISSPVVNYWWRGFPPNLSTEAYNRQLPQDQWAVRVTHFLSWLTYWWNTQKWFPALSAITGDIKTLSRRDLKIISNVVGTKISEAQATQQGVFESMHRTFMIGMGKWEFSAMDLENPFPDNEGSVHLWQGEEERITPVTLQRYIANKLPWIKYHELPGAGRFFLYDVGMGEVIIKELLGRD